MRLSFSLAVSCLLVVVVLSSRCWGVGESAVITLVFPPGARATGLGETFVAVADDANAPFFNPAGLGQSPLANSWKVHTTETNDPFTAIASKRAKDFGHRERIWAGTTRGLLRYNGKVWESYETYVIEKDDDLYSIAEKFVYTDDEKLIQKAVKILKKRNDIDKKRSAEIHSILRATVRDSSSLTDAALEDMTFAILELDKADQTAARIYGLLATRIDSTVADTLSDRLVKMFQLSDVRFEDLVELKIPFNIAVNDSVAALAIDESERLWVGTPHGLWNYDGKSWNYHSILDGLPSNNISAVGIGPGGEIALGTDKGVGLLSEGRWESFSVEHGLPDSLVTSVAFGKEGVLYAGTPQGLVQIEKSSVTVFDTTDGLLASGVTALLFDSDENLWIGGENGVTVYTGTSWKRFRFPDSRVHCIAEQKAGRVWIGTNKGAVSYKAGRARTDKEGKKIDEPPTWKAYHSRNALKGNDVAGIAIHGKDIWLATSEAVNQYDRADMEFLFFYEPILPAFGITDLWHIYTSYVLPTEDWGTLGLSFNYLNFGENTWTDDLGRELGKARSWEGVFALSYGLPIREDFSFGLNVKYIHSALAPGFGPGSEGIGRTFAIDAAILKRNLLVKNLSLGFQLQNMGPAIFYITRDEADPIPFTAKFGLAYTIFQTPFHDLKIVGDVNREIVKSYIDKRPDPFWKAFWTDLIHDTTENIEGDNSVERTIDRIKTEINDDFIWHAGIEYWYVNFIALRAGYMHDEAGYRREISFGVGLRYGNLGIDWSYIHAPGEMSIARHGQWRLSMIAKI